MKLSILIALLAIVAYLIGSINSAILVSRLLRREDIRKTGSGNAGTTNIWIAYGRKAGILTAGGDLLKAVIAVLIARLLTNLSGNSLPFDPGYLAGFFVLIGHVFPLFFAFKGGKAVMPAVGVIALVDPPVFVFLVLLAICVFVLSRKISVVSLCCACALPLATIVVRLIKHESIIYPLCFTILYSILVVAVHRDNIRRLVQGNERTIGKSRDVKSSSEPRE